MSKIEALYNEACETPSDIYRLLPHLRRLAEQAGEITEFGCRHGNSTTALLAAQPKRLVVYDVNAETLKKTCVRLQPERGRTDVSWRAMSTLAIEPIEPCDLLFIDTLHTYQQLRAELELHGEQARKWIAFHDTVTFGSRGEDGRAPGLMRAIREFMVARKRAGSPWRVKEHHRFNNGLLVLERAA